MKYQIIISERQGKLRPRKSGPVKRDAKRVMLKPALCIRDIAYWQKRVACLIDDLKLDEHAMVTPSN